MNKLINESEVSRELIYPNTSIPTYKLPNPEPVGYHQWVLSINCINWNNYTVTAPITITVYGVGNNPWFASVPFLISPSDAWIINSPIIGNDPLIINWWNTGIKKTLGFYGFYIADWLAKLAVIYGLLDGAAWFFGLPTPMSPIYTIMQGVIMELSLVLYLQIRAIGRLMQRAIRKITKVVKSRLQGTYQSLSERHPRLAKVGSAMARAVSAFRSEISGRYGYKLTEHITKEHASTPKAVEVISIAFMWYRGLGAIEQYHINKAQEHESMGFKRRAQLHRFLASSTRFVRDYGRIRSLAERGRLFEYTRPELSRLDRPIEAHHVKAEEIGDWVMYRPAHHLILTERLPWIRRVAHVIDRYTRPDWFDIFMKYENTEFGRLVRRLYETGEKAKAAALALAKELGERYIKPIKTQILLVREELGEVGNALAKGGFIIKHIGDKTITHFTDARLSHILNSLKQFSGYSGDAGEALGRAIERVTAVVRANLTRGALRNEYVNEVASRLKPLRDFVEAAGKGAIVSMEHPVIKRFIEFIGPEGERVVREILNTRGLIDKEAANEIINRLKPLINKRVSEEVEAAKYLVAVRHHAGEVVKEFTRELGIDKKLGGLEGELTKLEDFVRRAIASEFLIPKDRVANPNLIRGAEVVRIGNREYVVVREPFSRELSLDWQLPREVNSNEELTRITGLWVVHHYADRFHGWLASKPGNAIYYNSVYSGWVPGAVVLSALHSLGIDPSRLDWGGLLDNLERLDERINKVKLQLRETRDENEKTKLREELKRLEDEREGVRKALLTWANAIETLKLALPREEWESIYNSLPKKMRDFVDTARDPRDSFEAFLKRDGLKILAILDREGRKAGNRLGVDDVKEAMDLLKNHLPTLDKLIGPVRAEVIDELGRRVNNTINELEDKLNRGLFANTRLNAQSAKLMLEQARQELGSGNLDNAIRDLKVAIEHLREAAKEDSELVRAVGRLDESVKQLDALNALDRLMRGQAGPVDRNQPNEPSFFADFEGL
jgi:Sec-independent protein translocase protein TatA